MKIIVMPMYGMGDVLMSTPALRNIKEKLNAHITYLHMYKTTRDILIGNPNVDENIHFPFLEANRLEGVRFLLQFRKKFDASINFYPSNRKDYNLSAYIIAAPLRIGHRYVLRDMRELNFLKNRTVKEDDSLHNVEEDLRLLGFLGIKEKTPYPLGVYLTGGEKEWASLWLKENGLSEGAIIGLHPGSSVFKESIKKRWPHEKFAQLLMGLSGAYPDLSFLLFGGREELSLRQELKEASGLGRKVMVVDTGGIRQTAALMEHSRVFVTNDSGLMHLSAALQIPTVAIFGGPTNPVWLSPWKCKHRVIRLDIPCNPCFRYGPLPQRCKTGLDFICIRDIPVDEVIDATVSFLKRP